MDFVSTGGGSLVDNIFLLFNAYDWWVYYSKKEENNIAKKESEEKMYDQINISSIKLTVAPAKPTNYHPATNLVDTTVRNMIGSKPCPHSNSSQPVLPATNLARPPPPPHQDVLIRAILFSTHPTASRCAYKSHLVLDSSYRIKMCHQEPSCSRLILPHQDVLIRAILFSTHPTASRCAYKSHLVLDSSYRIKMCHQEPSCSRLILPHQDVL
ncbi:hypothetical protein WDU94_000161 [Cyamophila willieti]